MEACHLEVRVILRRIPILIAALLFSGPAVSCSRSGNVGAGGTDLSVVASFYPLAEAAQKVGGSFVTVINLTAPGVEPHDLELTPDQLEAISTARVVLYLGGGFQPAVEDAIGDAQGRVVDVSKDLRTLPLPPGESDATLTADPHVWLDPVLYAQIVDQVRITLDAADPSRASTFDANATAFKKELSTLDESYASGLAHCASNVIVTSHAAFGYLGQRYGLDQEAIAGLSPDAEPSPDRIAQLKDLVQRDGVTTIFTETLVSPKVADTLASEAGVTTAVLDPLESLSPDALEAGEDYVTVMQSNLTTLEHALGC
jgi:zinc transport system substrate-binding protein